MIVVEEIEDAVPPPRRRAVRRLAWRLVRLALGWAATPAALAAAEDAAVRLEDERLAHAATKRRMQAEIDGLTHEKQYLAKLFDASAARLDVLLSACEATRVRHGDER